MRDITESNDNRGAEGYAVNPNQDELDKDLAIAKAKGDQDEL